MRASFVAVARGLLVSCLACAIGAGCSLDRKPLTAGRLRNNPAAGGGVGVGPGAGSGAGGTTAGSGINLGGSGGASAGGAGTMASDACGGCDDGVFCNGSEQCLPGNALADARGCVTMPACAPSQTCDETARNCSSVCDKNPDADNDGFKAVACGGNDCDDAAANVNPAGVELCDGLDNDCNGKIDDGFAQFSCLSSNTLAACVVGQCVITVCSTGYADCNKLVSDGCETQLDPTAGDCQVNDCMGNSIPDDSDVPPDDGNECTLESCNNGAAQVDNAMDGTSCGNKKDKTTCQAGVCM